MAERKLPARAAILAAGCIMFLFTGTIYAWSILSSPFPVEFGWTSAQLGLNFTIVMSCFCIGGLAGSFVTRRLSARVTVLIGAVMCFVGYFLCSRITANSLWLLYISYGGLIGLGVGFSYNAVLGTVVGWFPDKKGFASGVLLMGFGCSTLIMGNLADRLFNSAMGWRTTYLLLGAATLVVLLIGSRWVVPNPHMAAPAGSAAAPARREYTTGQMVKTAAFWLLFFIIVCSNLIGTGVIGHSRYIAVEAGVATGITALVVGLQSVCNGLGRLAFGTLFDKKGNTFAMLTDVGCFILSCLLLLFSLRGGGAIPAVAGLLLIGYSGFFLFLLLENFQPGSFRGPDPGGVSLQDLFYFSYISLMTIGYGDITPVSWAARNATVLVSLSANIYSLVVIASIVGRTFASRPGQKADKVPAPKENP